MATERKTQGQQPKVETPKETPSVAEVLTRLETTYMRDETLALLYAASSTMRPESTFSNPSLSMCQTPWLDSAKIEAVGGRVGGITTARAALDVLSDWRQALDVAIARILPNRVAYMACRVIVSCYTREEVEKHAPNVGGRLYDIAQAINTLMDAAFEYVQPVKSESAGTRKSQPLALDAKNARLEAIKKNMKK